MKLNPVKSSNIKAIGYEGGNLHVQFASGKVYEYEGVTEKDFADLAEAKSIGSKFAKGIRNNYKGRVLTQKELEENV